MQNILSVKSVTCRINILKKYFKMHIKEITCIINLVPQRYYFWNTTKQKDIYHIVNAIVYLVNTIEGLLGKYTFYYICICSGFVDINAIVVEAVFITSSPIKIHVKVFFSCQAEPSKPFITQKCY